MSNTYYKGYKYRIYPTEEQATIINNFVNLYRFIYNWAISKEEERYTEYLDGKSEYKFYNFFDLCAEYKKFRDMPENYWLLDIPNTTSRLALRDAINAYNMFFKKHNRKPKFKSKKTSPKMFKTRNDRFFFTEEGVRFEGLNKKIDFVVKTNFDTGFRKDEKYIQPSISIDNQGRFWVSFSVKRECKEIKSDKTDVIGIDLGVRKTFTLSTGEVFNKPNDKLNRINRRISRLQRHITRDIKRRKTEAERTKTKYDEIPKSKRSIKRELKKRKLYQRQHDIKSNFYYEIANDIVKRNPKCVVMETIPVQDTARCKPYMAKTISQADFYWITQIVKNKCNEYNIEFIQADRNYKSSQICSCCGNIRNIGSRHTYICPVCGLRIDRDINAALNLKSLAV